MYKRYISRMVKGLALLIPVAIVVLVTQHYLFCYIDPNINRLRGFYNEEKNSLDVVFLGASELPTGFAPAYAYEKYGYTSYAYAMDSNPGTLYKSQLKEVLKNQDPELIFVEVNGFLYEESELMDEARLQMFTESIPMSWNKLETIFRYPCEGKLTCLLPFVKYHGDWAKPDVMLEHLWYNTHAVGQPPVLKGMISCAMVDKQVPLFEVPTTNDTSDIDALAEACLIDFLEYCRQEQLDNLIFVRFPHKFAEEYTYDAYFCANRIGEIAGQYGYAFINLEQKAGEIGIDYMNDFYNSHHLNVYGQLKLTDYLSELIVNQYHLTPGEQTEENKAHWEECVQYMKAYYEFADQRIKSGREYWMHEENYLMGMLEDIMRTQSGQDET